MQLQPLTWQRAGYVFAPLHDYNGRTGQIVVKAYGIKLVLAAQPVCVKVKQGKPAAVLTDYGEGKDFPIC